MKKEKENENKNIFINNVLINIQELLMDNNYNDFFFDLFLIYF